MSKTHNLKTWPSHFKDLMAHKKRYEVRKNDRDFQEGDVLHLLEYDPSDDGTGRPGGYAGAWGDFKVTHILHGGMFGIEPGYCVLGLSDLIKGQDKGYKADHE